MIFSEAFPHLAAKRLWLLALLCCAMVLPAQAQQTMPQAFGKNRIQYKNFNWQFYSTQNFNVYFYDGGNELAQHTAEHAERELKRITNLIGYYPYNKITLIVYNSVTDLKQSNIGLADERYQTGNETLFLKSRLELAFEGTQTEYKKQVSYKMAELLLNDMMYGGSLREVLQSSYLLRLPDWFLSGAAAYIAEGWSVEMDNYMRDMILKTKGKKPEQVFSRNQRLAGQAVWNYVAENYGYMALQNILNLTRITRDIEIGISSSLNVHFRQFLRDWHRYYIQNNTFTTEDLDWPDEENQLKRRNGRNMIYTQPAFSPDGSKVAYVVNDRGSYKVVVQETGGKHKKTVIRRGGYKTPSQEIDFKMPVLAWKTNDVLSLVEAKKGRPVLQNFSMNGKKTVVADLAGFQQVLGMSYSEDGKMMVLSAVRNGQSDLFLYRVGRQAEQLTNDIFDDADPVFLAGSRQIAFSSNRWLDTAATDNGQFSKVVDNYDIFLYDIDGGGNRFRQLTASIANETQPKPAGAGQLVYLSEQTGVRGLYRYDIASGEAVPVTNFAQNLKQIAYHGQTQQLAFVSADRTREFIYLYQAFAAEPVAALGSTVRQNILEERSKPVAATTQPARKIISNTKADSAKTVQKQNGINIQDYTFENEKQPEKPKQRPQVVRQTQPEKLTIAGPYKYDLRFSINNVVNSIYADPLLGIGIVGEVGMADLFEDHRVRGGIFTLTDLRTSTLFAEYSYLKKRYDFRMLYSKRSIFDQQENAFLRYGKHEITPTIIYPFTHSVSMRFSPTFVNTRLTIIPAFTEKDYVNNLGGANLEAVFDNSVVTGVNMMEGTRMKAGISMMRGLSDADESFNKFFVDLRHYQKIHKELVWANRVSYGHSFGRNPKPFLLGGMDNWLFARTDSTIQYQTLEELNSDIFYLHYATNMRGFGYNNRNGNKYFLYNTELRFPIVQYLTRQPVYSGFFRNLQLVAFADIGTAYNGANPFSRNNSFNTQVVGGNGDFFQATVVNYRNPFLVGYGFGARTTLLGLYGKLDVAWGEADKERRGPKFYFTLGYDF